MFKLLDSLPLNGKKSVISAVVMIIIGIAGFVMSFVDPESQHAMDPNTAIATIMAGVALLGIRHGVEKNSKNAKS